MNRTVSRCLAPCYPSLSSVASVAWPLLLSAGGCIPVDVAVEYEASATLVTKDTSAPLDDTSVDLLISHLEEVVSHGRDEGVRGMSGTTDSSGRLAGRVMLGISSWPFPLGLLAPPPPPPDVIPLQAHVIIHRSPDSASVTIPVTDSMIERNENGYITTVDLGRIEVDLATLFDCGRPTLAPATEEARIRPTVPDLAGTYHLPLTRDAINLVIREDGTFTWDWCICDSHFMCDGRVLMSDRQTVLESGDFPTRQAPSEFSDALITISDDQPVSITVTAEGWLQTTIDNDSLIWLPGRVCPICEDNFNVGIKDCCCYACAGSPPVEGVDECDELP